MADRALRGSGLGSHSFADSTGVEFAPRWAVECDCPTGHHFTVMFSEEAELPLEWECTKCGKTAVRADGTRAEEKDVKAPDVLLLSASPIGAHRGLAALRALPLKGQLGFLGEHDGEVVTRWAVAFDCPT